MQMYFLQCKLCKCRFCITLVCKCDFCKRLHYVYEFEFVYVYDLKREVRYTRTADKPPAPQHFNIWEAGFFRIRRYRNGRKETLIFFIFTLDKSAGWLYILTISQ